MFLSDPALRLIATHTGDVWSDHLWRRDTAATDPHGALARVLHRITVEFTDNHTQLQHQLAAVDEHTATAARHLRRCATAPNQLHRALAETAARLERHATLSQLLMYAYGAWRTHHPIGIPAVRHLLLRPGDPTFGVATLQQLDAYRWLVTADAEAAAAFAIPYAERVVGEITATDSGWQPIAHTHPHHRTTQPGMTYRLPATHDQATACRTLLRWWQLRHSTNWRNRRPDQLTAAELAALAE